VQYVGIFLAVVVLYFLSCIRILFEYERAVVFRLGRVLRNTKGPGLVLIFWPVDRMVRVSLRIRAEDVPFQDMITRDNVSVKVNAVVYFRVIEPMKAILEVENFRFPRLSSGLTFVAWTSETTKEKSVEITRMLRQEGISSQMDYDERSLKSQLKLANRIGADYAVIVGDEELADGEVLLRDMNTGAQDAVLLSTLKEVLKKRSSPC